MSVSESARTLGDVQALVHPRLDAHARERPRPGVWSTVEYLAHLRDAIAFYRARIERIIVSEVPPRLMGWDPDDACLLGRYCDEEPKTALREAIQTGRDLQALLISLSDEDAARIGIGGDGGTRTVASLAARAAHEVVHHGRDVRTGRRDAPRAS